MLWPYAYSATQRIILQWARFLASQMPVTNESPALRTSIVSVVQIRDIGNSLVITRKPVSKTG